MHNMFDDVFDNGFDDDDFIPLVEYTCMRCGEKAVEESEIKCRFCSISICNRCQRLGYCIDHYEKIPQNYLDKLRISKTYSSLLFSLTLITLFIIIAGSVYLNTNQNANPFLNSIIIISIPIIIIAIIGGLYYKSEESSLIDEINQILEKKTQSQ